MTEQSDEAVIRCEGVWKIFGKRAKEALEAIRTNGLSKDEIREQYDCVVGVQDASFSVRRGEIFCIMGLSGSGKSTLIRHINRLIEPTSGAIYIEGQNINDVSQRELRGLRAEKIGMVFQNMALMPHRTVLENVAFSQEVRGHDVKERTGNALRAIKAVELDGWESKYPDELSGGMQQRVGLARAIAADPSILLMDEPFSALDPLIRRQLQDEFINIQATLKKSIVFITHDIAEALKIADRIAIMRDGKIVQIGTPTEIVLKPVDDYVAEFSKDVVKGRHAKVASVMQPVNGTTPTGPGLRQDMTLEAALASCISHYEPVPVLGADGKCVGVVDPADLAKALQAEET